MENFLYGLVILAFVLSVITFVIRIFFHVIGVPWARIEGWKRFIQLHTAVCIGAVIYLAAVGPPPHSSTTPAYSQPQLGSPAEAVESVTLPLEQMSFLSILKQYAQTYHDAPNELKKSSVRAERRAAIQSSFKGSLAVTGWVGEVKDMGTTGDGLAYLKIELAGWPAIVETTNNALSDTLNGGSTLIRQGTAVYNSISNLSRGQKVMFGQFIRGDSDFLSESSLTENGAMIDPAFLMRFSSVKSL